VINHERGKDRELTLWYLQSLHTFQVFQALLGVTVPQNGSAMVQNKIHKKHRQSNSTCFFEIKSYKTKLY
jgi:hypothetical protein